MPKELKKVTAGAERDKMRHKELPMPKYGYQRPQGGSISSAYRSAEERRREPELQLQNVSFG